VTDPRDDPETAAWLDDNDPGNVRSDSPLLIVQGGRDAIVVPARTAALVDRVCALDQVVGKVDLPNADHGSVVPEGADRISAWVAARLADEPPPDDCRETDGNG
jgi:hypothetical protein